MTHDLFCQWVRVLNGLWMLIIILRQCLLITHIVVMVFTPPITLKLISNLIAKFLQISLQAA